MTDERASDTAAVDTAGDDDAVSVVVTGAGGRMGREVIAAASDRADVRVVGAVNRSPVAHGGGGERDDGGTESDRDAYGTVDGVPVTPSERLGDVLARHDDPAATVVVDFTAPAATATYAATAADHGVAFVSGTTGLGDADHDALGSAAASVPVVWASNFSRGIAALRRAVTAAARAVPGYDVEVTETHHDGKRDAPSGTAETLVDDVVAIRPDLGTRQHGREGVAPRDADEIGVHARRAGDVAGEHEVLLAGEENVLSLTHRAGSRRVFAAGALDAAAWVAGRDPGRYDFDDVLDEESVNAAVSRTDGTDADGGVTDAGRRGRADDDPAAADRNGGDGQ